MCCGISCKAKLGCKQAIVIIMLVFNVVFAIIAPLTPWIETDTKVLKNNVLGVLSGKQNQDYTCNLVNCHEKGGGVVANTMWTTDNNCDFSKKITAALALSFIAVGFLVTVFIIYVVGACQAKNFHLAVYMIFLGVSGGMLLISIALFGSAFGESCNKTPKTLETGVLRLTTKLSDNYKIMPAGFFFNILTLVLIIAEIVMFVCKVPNFTAEEEAVTTTTETTTTETTTKTDATATEQPSNIKKANQEP